MYRNFVTHKVSISWTNFCCLIGSLLCYSYIMHFNFCKCFFSWNRIGKGMKSRINLDMVVPRHGISFDENSMFVLHTVPNTWLRSPFEKETSTRDWNKFSIFLAFRMENVVAVLRHPTILFRTSAIYRKSRKKKSDTSRSDWCMFVCWWNQEAIGKCIT